jgi:hypothetical protein
MPADPILDHLEKSFADSYRKEIDQEENVWRSLPFFAATLALQLTALAQLRDWVLSATGPLAWAAAGLLGLAGGATLCALGFLAASIWPAEFRYLATEPEMLDYAARLREGAATQQPGATEQALQQATLSALRAFLVQQYAASVANNRAINRRRGSRRTQAGVAILISVLSVLLLLAVATVATSPKTTPAASGGALPHVVQPVGPALPAGQGPGPSGGP